MVSHSKKVEKASEKCVNGRAGRAPRCMGDVPVVEMVASEALGGRRYK